MPASAAPRHDISLALQGGGAHGAFTWGVLDALLEDGSLHFEGVSGSSAGAMNSAVLAQGLLQGGRDGAREALRGFWTAVAAAAPPGFAQLSADGQDASLSPLVRLMMQWTRHLSPEQFNPLDLNPLREILQRQLDFERLRRECPLKLFIATTRADSGRLHIFRESELSCELLLASACLPSLHRGVSLDGALHWDGGFAANPAVFPLFFDCRSRDLLLVLLSPLKHANEPRSAAEIQSRLLEIAFNATFLREMRQLAQWRAQLSADRWWQRLRLGRLERRLIDTRFHLIEHAELLGELKPDSKLAVNQQFFEQLMRQGRERAQAWLRAHRSSVGRRSSADIGELFG